MLIDFSLAQPCNDPWRDQDQFQGSGGYCSLTAPTATDNIAVIGRKSLFPKTAVGSRLK